MLTLYEDALIQYDELDAMFSQYVINTHAGGLQLIGDYIKIDMIFFRISFLVVYFCRRMSQLVWSVSSRHQSRHSSPTLSH